MDLFATIYPDYTGNLSKEISKLRTKNQLSDDEIDTSDNTTNARQVQKLWEIGHRNELKSPFLYCCYKCSRLLSNNRDEIVYEQDKEQDIPILRHYPAEMIVFPYRKGHQLVRCKKCTGRRFSGRIPS